MHLYGTEQLINWRRELHQNPELSNQEFATTQRITRWLQQGNIRLLPLKLKNRRGCRNWPGRAAYRAARGYRRLAHRRKNPAPVGIANPRRDACLRS